MIKGILSAAADEVLDMGIVAALGPEKVHLAKDSLDRIRRDVRNIVHRNDFQNKVKDLRDLLVNNVGTYRNTPSQDLLLLIREKAGNIEEGLRMHAVEYRTHEAYKPYQLAKAIHVRTFWENHEKYGAGPAELINVGEKSVDALTTLLKIEEHESKRMTWNGWARFKLYTYEGGDPDHVYNDPSVDKSMNPDLMRRLGHKYIETVRGFQKGLQKKRQFERHIPEPKYVCKYLKNDHPALNTEWIDQGLWEPPGNPFIYQCQPVGDYYPTSDKLVNSLQGLSYGGRILYAKRVRGKSLIRGTWTLMWEDQSADKEEDYKGGPWSFWRPQHRDYATLGSRIEKRGGGKHERRTFGRVMLFPNSDLENGDNGSAIQWNDAESRARDDVQLYRTLVATPKPDVYEYPNQFEAVALGDGTWAYWLKKSTLAGFRRLT